MADRKQTPDILADLLGGDAAVPASTAERHSQNARAPVASAKTPKTSSKSRSVNPATRSRALAQPAAPVQRWEHSVASFQDHRGWRLRFLDGVEVNQWTSGPLLPDTLRQMANDGWQVAAACAGQALFGVLDKYQLYFIRPSKTG